MATDLSTWIREQPEAEADYFRGYRDGMRDAVARKTPKPEYGQVAAQAPIVYGEGYHDGYTGSAYRWPSTWPRVSICMCGHPDEIHIDGDRYCDVGSCSCDLFILRDITGR